MKKERVWHSVYIPPTTQRPVVVKDDNGILRIGEPCYYPFDVINGKVVALDKEQYDGTWIIDETIPLIKGELGKFGGVKYWSELPVDNEISSPPLNKM